MATYTKETALYDTGKIGDDIATAGQTATSYLTTVSGTTGISVHDAGDTDNFVNMNSDGVGVYQDGVNVAQFGVDTRIGTADNASITISDDSITGVGEGGKEFFSFSNSSSAVETVQSEKLIDYRPISQYPTTSSAGLSTALSVSPAAGFVKLIFTVRKIGSTNVGGVYTCWFTKGTSASLSVNITLNSKTLIVYATYNGDKDFTNIYIGGSYEPDWKMMVYATYTMSTTAPSFKIGGDLHASGAYGIAEGYGTYATGNYSHAEGYGTHAEGYYSHTSGYNTIATGNFQFVTGQYNASISASPFIIGNGSADNNRSNALVVSWNGDVNIASGAKYKINGIALSASDVDAVPTTRKVNNKALSSDITLSASDVSAVPTTRTVNGKALSANVADADYVTEESSKTSGSVTWTYRKWHGGKIEAWCSYPFSSAASTVWTSPIRYWDKTISIPSGIFTTAPRLMVSAQSNQYWVGGASASSATAATARVLTVATGSMAVNLNIYAVTG